MTPLTGDAPVRRAHGYVDFWKVACPNRVILPATQYFERSL